MFALVIEEKKNGKLKSYLQYYSWRLKKKYWRIKTVLERESGIGRETEIARQREREKECKNGGWKSCDTVYFLAVVRARTPLSPRGT